MRMKGGRLLTGGNGSGRPLGFDSSSRSLGDVSSGSKPLGGVPPVVHKPQTRSTCTYA
jgi:hypothetical protein